MIIKIKTSIRLDTVRYIEKLEKIFVQLLLGKIAHDYMRIEKNKRFFRNVLEKY